MDAGVKTPNCLHLSIHFCISSTTINLIRVQRTSVAQPRAARPSGTGGLSNWLQRHQPTACSVQRRLLALNRPSSSDWNYMSGSRRVDTTNTTGNANHAPLCQANRFLHYYMHVSFSWACVLRRLHGLRTIVNRYPYSK